MWIQGDLHVENFGTYMDGSGVLIFDVNDFDEAYVGHFTLGPAAVRRERRTDVLAEGAVR